MSYIKNYFLKKDQEVGTDKKYSLTIACLPEHFSNPGIYKGKRESCFTNYFHRLFELGKIIMDTTIVPKQDEDRDQKYSRLFDQIQQNIHDYTTDLDINDKMMLISQSIKVFGSSRHSVCKSLFREFTDTIYDCEVVNLYQLCWVVKIMRDQSGDSFIDYNEHAEYLVEKIKKLLIDYQALVDGNQIKNFFSGLKLLNQLSLLIDDSRIVSSLRSFIAEHLQNALKDFEVHMNLYNQRYPELREIYELDDGLINCRDVFDESNKEIVINNRKKIVNFDDYTKDFSDKAEYLKMMLLDAADVDIAIKAFEIVSQYYGSKADRCLVYATKEVKKYIK